MVGINKSEKGQALIFLALGMVVFLGFVALAIDGGMLFSDRRHAQNASDASALSGGGQAAELVQACAEGGNNACKQSGWNCADPSIGAIGYAVVSQRLPATMVSSAGTGGVGVGVLWLEITRLRCPH
jgi:uncharacterized membrane protein